MTVGPFFYKGVDHATEEEWVAHIEDEREAEQTNDDIAVELGYATRIPWEVDLDAIREAIHRPHW
jgi:hypothetical protein